jgi:hypothetical protein
VPPSFSIVIPTFNRADDLATSLSALRTLEAGPDFEIVVADDGSSDSTADVVAAFADLPIRYDWRENQGVSAARNRGAQLAQNGYLAFLDTGDEPFPDWLTTFTRLIESYGALVVFCSCRAVSADGREWVMRTKRLGPVFNRITGSFHAGSFAVERQLFLDLGGYDPELRYSEGTDLGIRIAQQLGPSSDRTAHASRPHLTKHVPEGSSFAYSDRNRYDSATYMLDKHADLFATDPKLHALYERMAGVAAARLGDRGRARRHLLTAARLRPRDWTNCARAAAAVVPFGQQLTWSHGADRAAVPSRPPAAGVSADGPVFIVGAMRSGTTLLRLMLNEHPQLAIPAESHFVSALFRRFDAETTLGTDEIEDAVAIVAGTEEWQRDYAHDAEALRTAIGAGPMSLAELVDRVFRLETAPSGKPRWGDKTPAYLFRVDDLARCFRESQIIAIVRDPRDVYLSLRSKGWVGETPWDIARYLRRCDALVDRWTATLPRDRFTVVRYEDVVLDTDRTLHGLCGYLGMPFADEMRAFFETADEHVQEWELDIGAHNKLLRPPDPADVGRWRREGSRLEIAEVEALTADIIRARGYEPSPAPKRAAPLLRVEARVRHHLRRPEATARRLMGRSEAAPRVDMRASVAPPSVASDETA